MREATQQLQLLFTEIQKSQEIQKWKRKRVVEALLFNRIENFEINNKPSYSLKTIQFKLN